LSVPKFRNCSIVGVFGGTFSILHKRSSFSIKMLSSGFFFFSFWPQRCGCNWQSITFCFYVRLLQIVWPVSPRLQWADNTCSLSRARWLWTMHAGTWQVHGGSTNTSGSVTRHFLPWIIAARAPCFFFVTRLVSLNS
jgi:hypothetical protein